MYTEITPKNTIAYISSTKNPLVEKELIRCDATVLRIESISTNLDDWTVIPDAFIFDELCLDNWKQEWNKVKQIAVLQDIPCLLISTQKKEEEELLCLLKKGLCGYVFHAQLSMLVPLCISAMVHGKKIKEEQLKVNELNRVLSTSYLVIDAKNTLLDDIKKTLDKFADNEEHMLPKHVKELSKKIDLKIKSEYHYQLFKVHFEEVHPLFYKKLLKVNNKLTDHNLKLLAFLKMGFNNTEISFLLNISISSVKKSIQRLKPKLLLSPKDSIREFVFAL